MSLTVFVALCILGLDLLIYVFFHRIYGDKRSAIARQVTAFKGQSPNHAGSFHQRPVMGTRSRPIEGSPEKRTAERTHAASAVPGHTTQLRIFKHRVCRLWQSVLGPP
jgi:hypothetical protein